MFLLAVLAPAENGGERRSQGATTLWAVCGACKASLYTAPRRKANRPEGRASSYSRCRQCSAALVPTMLAALAA